MIKVFIVKNKLKRDVNMFERMDTFENIFEGVVEPYY